MPQHILKYEGHIKKLAQDNLLLHTFTNSDKSSQTYPSWWTELLCHFQNIAITE
jgi:hypothetical protein